MGLTTGHVFSDGDTVTAAKLNSMVNDATISSDTVTSAMIQDDAIDSRHIADGAITSNHITSGSVALDSIASGQTTEGYLIQTDASGDLTTLNAGAAGLALISNGAEAAPSYSAVSSSGIHPSMISGHIEDYSPDADDLILFKDKSLVVNRCAQLQNVYKTVSKLTELTTSVADSDVFLVIDGTSPKKITKANLESALSGVGIPSSGSSYFSSSDDTIYNILSRASKRATFTHGLGSVPRMVRAVLECTTDDSTGFGYALGDEIELSNHLYWDGDNYNVPGSTVICDSSSIVVQFASLMTSSGAYQNLMQKNTVGSNNAGSFYSMNSSGHTSSTQRFTLKVYAWA